MSLRWFLALTAIVAAFAALIALSLPISLDAMHQGAQIRCGSALSPDLTAAAQADLVSAYTTGDTAGTDYRGECNDKAGFRKLVAYPTMVLAGVVLLGVLVVRRPVNAAG
ncbi:hypothetical protein A5717_26285 [Mycolicibacterium porcinum]|uniref:hypothetical protein n=1 Tax=Mycolicibacterium porcinum TaxID=39693 RepID=UPI00080B6E28|nr:hypothetical protein [Mycolicibacterium porcinum]OCB09283.1 hypothetical protein A5717_26285 [Mycolicibacterium porcinum]